MENFVALNAAAEDAVRIYIEEFGISELGTITQGDWLSEMWLHDHRIPDVTYRDYEHAVLAVISRFAARALGVRGGKAGTGKSKVRGDSAYYRKLRQGK